MNQKKNITVCFFGIYDPNYERNRILIKGLRENGIEVIECNNREGRLKKYLSLIKQYWRIRKKINLMLVAFPGYQVMILAKILTRKFIIFDAFLSIYDAEVCDRKNVKVRSLRALYYWFLDWLSCSLADRILLDTEAQIDYYVKTFAITKSKFIRVLVGSDINLTEISKPANQRDYLLVHFHSKAHPMQGVRYVVEAAKILGKEKIKFNLIGDKIVRGYQVEASNNINFINSVPYQELVNYMAQADICLGIFGDSDKTMRVIPNKLYMALACRKPIITCDSPAARELLTDGINCLFCRATDAVDLANKIKELVQNEQSRFTLAENGFQLFLSKLTPKLVTLELASLIKNFFKI